MNKTVLFLIFSDIFVLTGFGLMQPILSIFIKENLVGGTIFAAGLASMLFLITKSLVQLPFSKFIDKGESSFRVKSLIIGTIMISLVPFIYVFSKHVNFIYVAQVIHGLGSGLAFPSWISIWSRQSGIENRSFHWSVYSTLTGVGTGIAALVGARIAELFGFTYTFLLVGIMALLGCVLLFFLEIE